VVAYANLDEKERTMIDYAELSREDAKAERAYAWDEGREQGLAAGLSQGIAQGFTQGITQGITQVRSEQSTHIARAALLKGLPVNLVQDITGLDADTIEQLQKGMPHN
jgi:predicted transposase YdaD